MEAPIREVFCSVQGEGPYLGARQVFVRFEGCNLNCTYCDTPQRKSKNVRCRVEKTPGLRDLDILDNPLSPERVSRIVQSYGKVHSVSLTGGEPLLHTDFIKALKVEAPLYLETNMTLPEKAREVKNFVKFVAGDLKLEEAFDGDLNYDEIYEKTVKSFGILGKNNARDCFCKVIVMKNFKTEEIVSRYEQINDYVSCLVLQPVTPLGKVRDGPSAERLFELQKELSKLTDVRIIPQVHKMLGVM